MATEIASVYVAVGADTSELNRGLRDAGRQLSNTERQFGQVGRASGGFDKSIRGTGLSLSALKASTIGATAGIVAFAAAAKKAFDMAQAGAAVEQTRESFDRLGVSLDDLRAKSLGTVDDMTLMSSTLTLTAGASEELQGHLLGAAPQLLEIAKAANALNPALGDTSFMYQSIATGVKRASPLILDNLGIMVKVGEANERYAAQVGKTVEQLTAEEKQIALLNATLEAGNRLIEQSGGSAASAGDAYAQLGTYVKNSGNDFKAFIHEALEPTVQWLADLLTKSQQVLALQRQATGAAVSDPTVSWEDYIREQARALDEAGQWAIVESNVSGAMDRLGYNTTETVKATKNHNATVETAIRLGIGFGEALSRNEWDLQRLAQAARLSNAAVAESGDVWAQYNRAANGVTVATHNVRDAWAQYQEATTGAAQASDRAAYQLRQVEVAAQREARATLLVNAVHSNLGDTLRDQESDLQDLYGQREDMLRQLEDLRGEHGRYITVQKEAAMTEAELAYSTALLADKRAKLAEADPGSLNAAKLAKDIEALEGKLADTGGAFTSMVDHGKEISELEGNIAGVTAKIDDLTAANREAVASFMFEQVVSRFDLGALTEAQSIVLEGLAEAAGIDTTFIKLTSGLLDYEQGWDGVGESVDEANENARHFLGIADQMALDPDLSWAEAADRYFSNLRQSAGGTVQPLLDTEAAALGIGGALGEAGDAALDLPERMTEARDGAQQPMMDMEGYAIGLGTALETAGTTGVRSLSEISATTGNAIAQMEALGLSAAGVQIMLDRMHGKKIDMEINWVERNRPQTPDGAFIEGRADVGWYAEGGTIPMGGMGIAGEAGPELLQATSHGIEVTPLDGMTAAPLSGGGGMSGGASVSFGDINIYGATDPQAVLDALKTRLAREGVYLGRRF